MSAWEVSSTASSALPSHRMKTRRLWDWAFIYRPLLIITSTAFRTALCRSLVIHVLPLSLHPQFALSWFSLNGKSFKSGLVEVWNIPLGSVPHDPQVLAYDGVCNEEVNVSGILAKLGRFEWIHTFSSASLGNTFSRIPSLDIRTSRARYLGRHYRSSAVAILFPDGKNPEEVLVHSIVSLSIESCSL